MIKKLLKLSILVALISNKTVTAGIIETNSLEPFENAAETATNDTLIIFDVQEVLIVAKDQILTPLYKDDYRVIKDRIISTYPHDQQIKLFSTILSEYQTEIVDHKIVKTLENLKQKGIKAIALTSGYTGSYGVIKSREDLRLKRLNEIGISFKDSFPNIAPLIFLHLEGVNSKHLPMFKDGVIFACRLSKGEVLKAFLNEVNYKPKKIIFVDNQLKNMKSVESYCQEEGIEFIGFHYNFIRSKPKLALNKKVVQYQFKVLERDHRWLSDKEAQLGLSR